MEGQEPCPRYNSRPISNRLSHTGGFGYFAVIGPSHGHRILGAVAQTRHCPGACELVAASSVCKVCQRVHEDRFVKPRTEALKRGPANPVNHFLFFSGRRE